MRVRRGAGVMGEGGVVVIDTDQATVRLVRSADDGGQAPEPDPAGLQAQEILMGFLHLTRGA